MKPPRFQYCAPDMLDEALALLDQCGGEAKVLAGGQSLIPLLNMRLAGPAYIVDINHISELNYIEAEDGYLAIGATVRQRQVERSSLVQAQHPVLIEVVQHIGHMQIRNRGTIAGSIAHADPAAELPALVLPALPCAPARLRISLSALQWTIRLSTRQLSWHAAW